jgi:uncharacterized membrane protein
MTKERLLAFTDAVIAIALTIMVLELKAPHEATLEALGEVVPIFLSYVLSFVYIAIYWNNHHHMFQLVEHVDGAVLWANMHLIFWLSLVPFTTAWMDETHAQTMPVAIYGVSLLMPAIAYYILQLVVIRAQGGGDASPLRAALGNDLKGKLSPLFYVAGIALSFLNPLAGIACYVIVALIWLVPDRRVERHLAAHRSNDASRA